MASGHIQHHSRRIPMDIVTTLSAVINVVSTVLKLINMVSTLS
ncbi:hypothetical protein [Prescottella agglutinans]|nr:hypothetical protein [Prescottella agglutinans]